MTRTFFVVILCSIVVLGFFGLEINVASTANKSRSVSNQLPVNMVKIGNFYMDTYEFPNKIGALPVTNVTWSDAKALCESVGKRLCSADEWVRACRGPQGYRFPYGQEYHGTKCNSESPVDAPMRIGETPKTCVSGYGVYDLNGNVWEWVGVSLEEGVMVRGGAWSSESCAECALKLWENSPNTKSDRGGFRCCKS